MRPDHVKRLIEFYEGLSPSSLGEIGRFYTNDAYFKDPFNEVHGLDRIEAIFRKMYRKIREPRFVVNRWVGSEQDGFIVWDMKFYSRWMRGGGSQTIHGVSHIRFDAAGKVSYHRDYWDTGEELYAKLPLIGSLIRRMRRSMG